MRYSEIDGIRGYASLVVLLYHMIFTPFEHMGIALSPGFLLFNAAIAVQIFFVLSGDALSAAYFAHGDCRIVDKLVIKRYFRLTMLVLISSLITYFLMAHGLAYHQEAAKLTNNTTLSQYLPQQPDFSEALVYALSGVYMNYSFHTHGGFLDSLPTAYNPVFWTISVEMGGSILVFLFLYIFPRLAKPYSVLLFLCIAFLLLSRTFAGFFFGLLFGYFRQQGWLNKWRANLYWQYISSSALALYVLSFSLPINYANRDISLVAAVCLVFLFYTNNSMMYFFRTPFSKWLGSISFPLYAIHFPVLISLSSALIISSENSGGLTSTAMATISCISILVSLLLAALLRRIEQPYLKGLEYVASYAVGKSSPQRGT